MLDNTETHLTKRQLEVLRRKKNGMSIQEIAEELNTSVPNISHILESAKKNVKKSENTLKLVMTIEWPIKLDFETGTDLFDISKKIFEKADKENVHLDITGSELVELLGDEVGNKTVDREIQVDIRVAISGEGKIEVLTS